jgi:hypothetical protein
MQVGRKCIHFFYIAPGEHDCVLGHYLNSKDCEKCPDYDEYPDDNK